MTCARLTSTTGAAAGAPAEGDHTATGVGPPVPPAAGGTAGTTGCLGSVVGRGIAGGAGVPVIVPAGGVTGPAGGVTGPEGMAGAAGPRSGGGNGAVPEAPATGGGTGVVGRAGDMLVDVCGALPGMSRSI